jgi:predicted Zn-dependent protease
VYAYAGGVGIRSGNPEDVSRLLTAGLYNEAQVQRKAGKGEDANRLIQMLVERNPTDVTTRLMWAESLLLDRKDPAATLATLDSITVRPDDARLRPRRDMLAADALRQAGRTDSARAVLQALSTQFPANPRVKAKLDSLK